MARLYHVTEGFDERDYPDERMLEKAFREGCEHGYRKAMREAASYDERRGRMDYREGFEEKIERLKEKYR